MARCTKVITLGFDKKDQDKVIKSIKDTINLIVPENHVLMVNITYIKANRRAPATRRKAKRLDDAPRIAES